MSFWHSVWLLVAGEGGMEMSAELTRTQERAMQWLRGGHRARRRYGTVVYINGGKLCTVATMTALERMGLVRQSEPDEWVAVKKGSELDASSD